MTLLVSAAHQSPTLVRLKFDVNLDRDSALEDLGNYKFTATNPAKNTNAIGVVVPSLEVFDYIDVIIPGATDGGSYSVAVNTGATQPITSNGTPIPITPVAFVAVGDPPTMLVVLAPSANKATIYFSKTILDLASTRDKFSWHFNLGLTVTSIAEVTATTLTLNTSTQTPNQVYTLTFSGELYDVWGTTMVNESTSPMLGFVAAEAGSPEFTLPQMYNFLFEGVRQEDAKTGFLLKRYLDGFQTVWGAIVEFIYALKKNKDPASQSGETLRFLANFIGWSESNPNTRIILDALDDSHLRSLISISPQFWKDRGSPDAEDGLIALVTGSRRYTLDWFDVRTIVDEMENGEEHDGTDPLMVSEEEQYMYNLRVVDDGTLDRATLRAIARLCRPTGERVLLTYMLFIERFGTAGDLTQFSFSGPTPSVTGGKLALTSIFTQEVWVSVPNATSWKDYLVHWKVKAQYALDPSGSPSNFNLVFHRANGVCYMVYCSMYPLGVGNSGFNIMKGPAGSINLPDFTTLAGYNAPPDKPLVNNADYVFRIHVRAVATGIQITLYVDGQPIMECIDTASFAPVGSFGIHSWGGNVYVDELEAILLPAQAELIEINT